MVTSQALQDDTKESICIDTPTDELAMIMIKQVPQDDTTESIRMDTGMDELATFSIARMPRDDTQPSISTGTIMGELPMFTIMKLSQTDRGKQNRRSPCCAVVGQTSGRRPSRVAPETSGPRLMSAPQCAAKRGIAEPRFGGHSSLGGWPTSSRTT